MIRRSVKVSFPVAFIFGALCLFTCAHAHADGPAATLTFRKIFKSSYPEFVEIKVTESGAGTFDIRQLEDDANPQPFVIGAPLAHDLFALAAKLHNFDGISLDVHRRIANLGQKTFRYEKGTESHEVTFNYTMDPAAAQLLALFENISSQQRDLADLQHAMRFDRLGVNDALIQIESDYNSKQLPEPERFLPSLDQVASNEQLINIARDRARSLASRIRSAH